MATTTYVPIISYTLPSAVTSVTLGTGGQGTIPSTYTDLVLVISNFGMSSGGSATRLRFNGSASSLYSATWMGGYNTTPFTSLDSGQDSMRIIGAAVGPSTASNDNVVVHIQNYANTNVNKTVLVRGSLGTEVYQLSGLWRSTAAVNSITLLSYNGTHTINAGTKIALYGISNAAIEAPKASGGIITYDDTYFYHTFGASGTFTPQQSLTADILVVAGGGGGSAAGGGAGGLLGFASQSLATTGYTVTVGAGGNGISGAGSQGNNGGDSQFGALTLVKGGGGGAAGGGNAVNGSNGGSGGGAFMGGASNSGSIGYGGSPTSGQGYAGGNTHPQQSSKSSTGGGGGAGGAGGTPATNDYAGAGGIGLSTYSSWGLVTGTGENVSGTVYYAGGGGGGYYVNGTNLPGGYGGGGAGTTNTAIGVTNGKPNSGGGGGGAYSPTYSAGGNGGSGVVIIRYLKA